MKPLVFNSTPLIYLGKAGVLQHLKEIKGEKLTSLCVFEEVVVKGKEKSAEEAFVIEKLIEEKVIDVRAPKKEFLKPLERVPKIHKADAEVLALADELDGIAIVDDDKARKIGNLMGIENRGSIYILFRFFDCSVLDKEGLKKTFDEMVRLGWRCSTELYAAVLEEIERL
ncbi:MAG: hypothetical protein A7316_06005 [Candidatus Altiarchaeales archaeon WOR_SM1_86-2]|nr:MAG: hypothetical protein A7316_06005 [Candidatus Altiarchaeales archaeon WOR_SM1_86-2]ODS41756.1 MAG: hypothetical protein A7315_00345 [Candidatus Altiarchaeales archaeon WOR_SM1_79]